MDTKKSVRLSLVLTYIFIAALIIITVALPWLVNWYVEIKGRSASLPTTILVTCYPCAPIVAVALFELRKLLKNIMNDVVFDQKNTDALRVISICCIIIAVATIIAGRFYLPFYIVGGTFAFLSLAVYVFKNLFKAALCLNPQPIEEEITDNDLNNDSAEKSENDE